MGLSTMRFSEYTELLYHLSPVSVTNGAEVFTSYVSLKNFHRACIILSTGVMAGSSTIDAVVHQATDTSGGSAKHLTTSKAITQLTQAGGDSGKQVIIEIDTSELDVGGGFDCIGLGYTVGAAASIMCIQIFGLCPRYKETSTSEWDEVVD
jgi:hypothetical protein